MNSHTAEIVPEPRFEENARGWFERLAWGIHARLD
jgi:hypothetical protein